MPRWSSGETFSLWPLRDGCGFWEGTKLQVTDEHYNLETHLGYLSHWGRDRNGCQFADNILKCLFLNKKVWVSIKISLKCIPNGSTGNISALVQIMAWHRTGDKPLSGTMMTQLTDTYMLLPASMCYLTLKWLGHFFQNVISFSDAVHLMCNIFIWNWSNTMNV